MPIAPAFDPLAKIGALNRARPITAGTGDPYRDVFQSITDNSARQLADTSPMGTPNQTRLQPVRSPALSKDRSPVRMPPRTPIGAFDTTARMSTPAGPPTSPLAAPRPQSGTDFGGLLSNITSGLMGRADNAFSAPSETDITPASGETTTPDALTGYSNGRLPGEMLASVGQGGHKLYAPAATAWQALVASAAQQDIQISITDSYRTYDEQVDLAKRKGLYSEGGLAAVPGTSEHGWGLAVDANVNDPKTLQWLRDNAARFGFGQPGGAGGSFSEREPWHWEWQGNSGSGAGGGAQASGGGGGGASGLQAQAFQAGLGAAFPGMNTLRAQMIDFGPPATPAAAMASGSGRVVRGIGDLLANQFVTPNPYSSPQSAGGAIGSGLANLVQSLGAGASGGVKPNANGTYGFGAIPNANAPKYNAQQIAQVAYNAGFRGDDLRTMVAIAMAESGGNVGAHNPKGEDSRGLWQINVDAHGEKYGDLYNAQNNANAAFDVWQQAGGFRPWTVTHDSRGAPYKQYLGQAMAALQALGYL